MSVRFSAASRTIFAITIVGVRVRMRVSWSMGMRLLLFVVLEPLHGRLPLIACLLLTVCVRMRPCVRVVVLAFLVRVSWQRVVSILGWELRVDS